jgi:hypothetical protein
VSCCEQISIIFAAQYKRKMFTPPRIARLLLLVSCLLLLVPVVPHHHHSDGLICMRDDLTADCCGHSHSADAEHCCCDTGCLTTHFFQKKVSDAGGQSLLTYSLLFTLLPPDVSTLLAAQFEPERQRPNCIYVERLHGTHLLCAGGLRAPPSFL